MSIKAEFLFLCYFVNQKKASNLLISSSSSISFVTTTLEMFVQILPSARKCREKFQQHIISIWTNLQSHCSPIVRTLQLTQRAARMKKFPTISPLLILNQWNIFTVENFSFFALVARHRARVVKTYCRLSHQFSREHGRIKSN